MRLLLTLVFVIACTSSDRAARAQRDSVNARVKEERETARLEMARALVKARVGAAALDQLSEQDEKLDVLQARVDHARAGLATTTTAVQRQAIEAELHELEVGHLAITEAKRAIERAAQVEQRRIGALPASCFTNPPPADCKIPPQIAEDLWTAPDAAGEPRSRVME